MKPYVDHILCILPFEPAELERLGGPPGTFVGHRLTGDAGMRAAATAQAAPRDFSAGREKSLLLLPGSRRSEVSRLIQPFGETVSILQARGHRLRLVLPTVLICLLLLGLFTAMDYFAALEPPRRPAAEPEPSRFPSRPVLPDRVRRRGKGSRR